MTGLRLSTILLLLLVHASLGYCQPKNKNVADTPPLSPEEQLKKFRLPPGFVIQFVAGEPKINKPININFDARGRLWVTESVEYPFAAPASRPGRDKVKILEDFAPTGLAQKVTTFVDDLNIPIGVLPVHDGAIVYSIPSIHHIKGADKANERGVLYTGYGFKDTHGMTGEFIWGFDGWIYCCHGFSNSSDVKSKGTTSIQMTSGNTYRIKADGSAIEYYTHGQVNPFGITFDPFGNLYSADCHTRPIYRLLKGAHYPSFQRPDDGLGFAPEIMTHGHGSTAISGIAYYDDDRFPPAFRNNLFIGNVVTNRINRDRLEWKGASVKAIEMPDFLTCDDPWFRPVDIKLGPDGALYFADFYNRIIGHYEVPLDHPGRDREKGRIWRIVYVGDDVKPRPVFDPAKLTPAELTAKLDIPNLPLRMHLTNELVRRGGKDVEQALRATLPNEGFPAVHALWALHRLKRLDDNDLARASTDEEEIVRVHALKVVGDRPAWQLFEKDLARHGLKDASALVQLAAAEAIANHPSADLLPALLEARAKAANDPSLLYMIRLALRAELRQASIWATLPKDLSEVDAKAIADVCPGVHSEGAANYLAGHLERYPESGERLKTYARTIVRYGTVGHRTTVLQLVRKSFDKDPAFQASLLKTVQQSVQERGEKLGAAEIEWAGTLAIDLLRAKNPKAAQEGIDLAQSFKLKQAMPTLVGLVVNAGQTEAIRKNAVAASLAIDPSENLARFTSMLLNDSEPIALREQVATSLAGTNQAKAHEALIEAVTKAPARLQTTIALGMAGSPQGGEKLLEAVALGKASARLLQERAIELKLQQAKIKDLSKRLATLTKGLPPADERLQNLVTERREAFAKATPDAVKGKAIFTKHCAACHQVANEGAKIGPQLDGIGIRGFDRILEDILDPNRNVDQVFRASTLSLDNGQFLTGLFLREEGAVMVLADAQGKEVRVPKNTVQERITNQMSPMPANIVEQIPEADFVHLLAYLLSQRPKG